MDELEDFIIKEPYVLCKEDKEAISKASPKQNKGNDWEKECLNDFKLRLKNHLRERQNGRCAYCRCKIHEGEASIEIEHIIPKNKKPEWMYEPINLCLSCKRCNTAKGHLKEVLSDPTRENFPVAGNDYLLVNPYYDRYSDNIELIDGIMYKGKTKKGIYTIQLCKLNRYELAYDRAEALINQSASNYLRLFLLAIEEEKHSLIDDWDKFIAKTKMMDSIKKYKQNRIS